MVEILSSWIELESELYANKCTIRNAERERLIKAVRTIERFPIKLHYLHWGERLAADFNQIWSDALFFYFLKSMTSIPIDSAHMVISNEYNNG